MQTRGSFAGPRSADQPQGVFLQVAASSSFVELGTWSLAALDDGGEGVFFDADGRQLWIAVGPGEHVIEVR